MRYIYDRGGINLAEQLNIYQKLAKIRKQVEVVQKNRSGYGYRYVTDDELMAKISGVMDKYGVSLIPSVVPDSMSVEPYTYEKIKKGEKEIVNEILVSGEMQFTWVDNANPDDRITVDWAVVGQQSDASQSFGSGLTYAYRYFLLKFFGVATPEDDPDKWRSKQREAAEAEERAIAKGLIEAFHTTCSDFLENNPDKKDDVKAFLGQYAKESNYFAIKEVALANKLIEDFQKNFLEG